LKKKKFEYNTLPFNKGASEGKPAAQIGHKEQITFAIGRLDGRKRLI
jgi:hypothetical protein